MFLLPFICPKSAHCTEVLHAIVVAKTNMQICTGVKPFNCGVAPTLAYTYNGVRTEQVEINSRKTLCVVSVLESFSIPVSVCRRSRANGENLNSLKQQQMDATMPNGKLQNGKFSNWTNLISNKRRQREERERAKKPMAKSRQTHQRNFSQHHRTSELNVVQCTVYIGCTRTWINEPLPHIQGSFGSVCVNFRRWLKTPTHPTNRLAVSCEHSLQLSQSYLCQRFIHGRMYILCNNSPVWLRARVTKRARPTDVLPNWKLFPSRERERERMRARGRETFSHFVYFIIENLHSNNCITFTI